MIQAPLSELRYPFPSAINEDAKEIHVESVEWARRLGLVTTAEAYEKALEGRLGWLAGYFHPTAGREKLRLISDWCAWMFLRDDLVDDANFFRHPERLASLDTRFLDILRGADPAKEDYALSAAIANLRERLRPEVPAALWMRRFIRSVKEHFDSTLWESINRARGIVPDLATYNRMRPITGGMDVDTNFIEIATGIYLPPEVHGHRVVSSMTRISSLSICWMNDLFSLQKELARGDVHNIVLIIQNQEGLTLDEAIKKAVEMNEDEVRSFLELEKELPSFGPAIDGDLQKYVSILKTRMSGNLDWSMESARYKTFTTEGRF
ncbi:MAG: terpene synthase family protein [Rubrobacteraceae bacterium]